MKSCTFFKSVLECKLINGRSASFSVRSGYDAFISFKIDSYEDGMNSDLSFVSATVVDLTYSSIEIKVNELLFSFFWSLLKMSIRSAKNAIVLQFYNTFKVNHKSRCLSVTSFLLVCQNLLHICKTIAFQETGIERSNRKVYSTQRTENSFGLTK